jgi:hypothetical protein
MSHASPWTCRACRAVLGQVRDGVLRPTVPVESVDGRGVTRVPCPDCGRVRMWGPSPEGPASSKPHDPGSSLRRLAGDR